MDKNQKYQELLKRKQEIDAEIKSLNMSEAKIFRFTGYYVDINNNIGDLDQLQIYIDYYMGNNAIKIFNKEEAIIGWCDDIDINKTNVTQEEYDKYFESQTTEQSIPYIKKPMGVFFQPIERDEY